MALLRKKILENQINIVEKSSEISFLDSIVFFLFLNLSEAFFLTENEIFYSNPPNALTIIWVTFFNQLLWPQLSTTSARKWTFVLFLYNDFNFIELFFAFLENSHFFSSVLPPFKWKKKCIAY